MKPLEPSSSAAAALGSEGLDPRRLQPVDQDPAPGALPGPTTTRSMASRVAKSTRPSMSSAPIPTQVASAAIPALPGAQKISEQSGEAAKGPTERMFAAAAAHHQNFHELFPDSRFGPLPSE